MVYRILCLCLFSVLFCAPAAAQETSARVVWYGVFTVKKTEEIKDPNSPTGNRYVEIAERPKTNTDRIPGKPVRFGIGYVLSGKARASITVKELYRFPPGGMHDAKTGEPRSTYESVVQWPVGKTKHMGWIIGNEIVPGAWTFEVWQGARKLIEQRFTVLSP